MRALMLVVCGCGRIGFDPTAAGDGGPLGDGAGDVADVGAQPLCGSTVLLSDDFEDGVAGPEWTVTQAAGMNVMETGGFLQIQFATFNVAASTTAGYSTNGAFDFSGGCLDVELATAPDPTKTGEALIEISNAGAHASFYVGFNMLSARILSPSENDNSPPASYDPVAHRWLRIADTGGTWSFLTGPDGVTYTLFYSVTYAFATQGSTLYLDADSGNGGTSLGQVQYGSVRLTGP